MYAETLAELLTYHQCDEGHAAHGRHEILHSAETGAKMSRYFVRISPGFSETLLLWGMCQSFSHIDRALPSVCFLAH